MNNFRLFLIPTEPLAYETEWKLRIKGRPGVRHAFAKTAAYAAKGAGVLIPEVTEFRILDPNWQADIEVQTYRILCIQLLRYEQFSCDYRSDAYRAYRTQAKALSRQLLNDTRPDQKVFVRTMLRHAEPAKLSDGLLNMSKKFIVQTSDRYESMLRNEVLLFLTFKSIGPSAARNFISELGRNLLVRQQAVIKQENDRLSQRSQTVAV